MEYAAVKSENLSDGSEVFCVHLIVALGGLVQIDAKNEEHANHIAAVLNSAINVSVL